MINGSAKYVSGSTAFITAGNDKVITEELATWFAGQAASHIPDGIAAASGPAPSGPATGAPATGAAPSDGQQPDQTQGQTTQTQAIPKDLAVKLDEAGKHAEKKEEKEGSDERGSWYQVRYERPRTFAAYRSGAVTIVSRVFVARDGAAATQIFQEHVKPNETFPEAKEKVGDPFELKDGNETGDESRGLSACHASCNTNKEIYLHKRLVARIENVVSVTYIWGLANE